MNRTQRHLSIAAASVLVCVGAAPVWAADGGAPKSDQPSKGVAWGKKKEALRAYKRLDKDSKRSCLREGRDLRAAMAPSFDAARALAAGEHTADDVAALQASFDSALADALAASLADLQAVIDARMMAMKDAGATDRQLGKAQKIADRLVARLNARAAQTAHRFSELMAELFGPSDDMSDDSSSDDDDPAPEPEPLPPEPAPEPDAAA